MIGDILDLFKYIKEETENVNIFSALFSYTGDRKSGDSIIKIRKHIVNDKNWFYEVEDYGDYVFIPFPVNPAVYADYGLEKDHVNPSTKFFRYVSSPMAKFTSGGEPNVEVDFIVFGYQPKDLLARRKRNQ